MQELKSKHAYNDLQESLPKISNYICNMELRRLARKAYEQDRISKDLFTRFDLCLDGFKEVMFNDIKRFDLNPKKNKRKNK